MVDDVCRHHRSIERLLFTLIEQGEVLMATQQENLEAVQAVAASAAIAVALLDELAASSSDPAVAQQIQDVSDATRQSLDDAVSRDAPPTA